jgi:protein tyrosine/serine phosphatase
MKQIAELGLIPVRNFGILGENLYRSAQPIYPYEWLWLKEMLGIERVIDLRSESDYDKKLAPQFDMVVEKIAVADHYPPEDHQAIHFLRLLKEEPDKVTLFHCEHGHGRTSTFSVLAKTTMGMSMSDAIADEQARFHYKFRHPAQLAFLSRFEKDHVFQS